MTYLHSFTKKYHLLSSITARLGLVLMLLVGMLGSTTLTAPALASDDGIFGGGQDLDDPRPVSGQTGIPPAGPVWAIASDVLAYDHQGPDDQLSTAAAVGSAIMPETVSAGPGHTCGLKTDGSVACWGLDNYGQSTPPAHSAGAFAQVSAGGYHTCGLKTDGSVACWGDNGDGQSTPPQEPVYLPIILRNH
jgi:hypothetical protein